MKAFSCLLVAGLMAFASVDALAAKPVKVSPDKGDLMAMVFRSPQKMVKSVKCTSGYSQSTQTVSGAVHSGWQAAPLYK